MRKARKTSKDEIIQAHFGQRHKPSESARARAGAAKNGSK